MREYKIEARASVPYAMYIRANSNEEAREIAEKKAESYVRCKMNHVAQRLPTKSKETDPNYLSIINTDYDSWSMTVDDFALEIESVNPVCMRRFIPNYDD